MKKRKILCGLLALSLLFTCGGCSATVPTESYSVDVADYDKLTDPDELAADAAEALAREYSNFNIDCLVPAAEDFPDTYYHIDYNFLAISQEECLGRLKSLIGIWGFNCADDDLTLEITPLEGTDVEGQYGYLYRYEKDGTVGTFSTAAIWLFSLYPFIATNMQGEEQVARYRIDEGEDISGVSYALAGEEYSLTDAVILADEYVEQLLALSTTEDARLRTILVYQSQEEAWDPYVKNGDYVYLLYYECMESGLPIDEGCEMYYPSIPFFRANYIEVQITAPGEVSRVEEPLATNKYSRVVLKDGILPLSYALDSAEATLAQYSDYTVSAAELKYCTLSWWLDSDTQYYEPWWCLKMENGETVLGGQANDPRAYVYVNAVTGETYYLSSIPGKQVGTDRYFENPEWDPVNNPNSQWRKKNGG